MSLFQPLVAGKVLENCGRVFLDTFHPQKLLEFLDLNAAVSKFRKKEDKKPRFLEESWSQRCELCKKLYICLNCS